MNQRRTSQKLRPWVRGVGLAVLIVAGVGLLAMGPKVLEWERRWMVARCPIAYVGEDGRIHLTNERGTLDVELEAKWGEVEAQYVSYFAPRPEWSPDGQLIAYTHIRQAPTNAFEQSVAVIEPGTGRRWQPLESPQASFGGWVRDDVLNADGWLIDARSGASVLKPQWADAMRWISRVPEKGGGGWIVVGTQGLHFRTEDFRMRMPIWSSYGAADAPRVDPSGQWAGWTSHNGPNGEMHIKRIDESVAKPTTLVWPAFMGSAFCDWTAEGDIFANVWDRHGQWGLVILDKQGTVLRRITTEVRPMAASGASWRGASGGGR